MGQLTDTVRAYPVLASIAVMTAIVAAGRPTGLPVPFELVASFGAACMILAPVFLAIDFYRIRYGDLE